LEFEVFEEVEGEDGCRVERQARHGGEEVPEAGPLRGRGAAMLLARLEDELLAVCAAAALWLSSPGRMLACWPESQPTESDQRWGVSSASREQAIRRAVVGWRSRLRRSRWLAGASLPTRLLRDHERARRPPPARRPARGSARGGRCAATTCRRDRTRLWAVSKGRGARRARPSRGVGLAVVSS
jgi:hypothetical protein